MQISPSREVLCIRSQWHRKFLKNKTALGNQVELFELEGIQHRGLTFIKASSCFAPLFLSRFARFVIPAEHMDLKTNLVTQNSMWNVILATKGENAKIDVKVKNTLCRWYISWFSLCWHKNISCRHHHWYSLKCTNHFTLLHRISLNTYMIANKRKSMMHPITNIYGMLTEVTFA